MDAFDEAGYLRANPGIAGAVAQGLVPNPWTHYIDHGRAEGRFPNDVDPDFYLAAYPEVATDLGHPPEPADAARHYLGLGRARGYLPNANAPRPANAAAFASPFGGLWTDNANALDLIDGRLELGLLKRRDISLLRSFALDGIVGLERPPDIPQVKAAGLMIEQALTGAFPDLLFSGAPSGAEPQPWQPELTARNVAVLDPHMVSRAIRDLVFDKQVTDPLSALFDSRPRLTATRGFLREQGAPDRDVAWFAHTLPLQFLAVTFSLDDAESGVSAWTGSHRLPDLPWSGAADLREREAAVRALIVRQEPRAIPHHSGSRTIRHANLIHAVRAPEQPLQHLTLTAWYCPSHVTPCYFETARTSWHVHNGFRFASGVYPALDPRD
jgi:hypothetical protein